MQPRDAKTPEGLSIATIETDPRFEGRYLLKATDTWLGNLTAAEVLTQLQMLLDHVEGKHGRWMQGLR